MIRCLLLVLFFGYPILTFAQRLEIDKNDLTIKRSNQPLYVQVHLSFKDIPSKEQVKLSVTDRNSGTAQRNVDYIFPNVYNRNCIDTAVITILINPNANQRENKTIILDISASYKGQNFAPNLTTLNIKPLKKPDDPDTRKLYAIDSTRFSILTAGSISFFGNPLFSKYVGQLNINMPSLLGKNKSQWGINAGIFTKSFYADSVFSGQGTFNVRKSNDTSTYSKKTYLRYSKTTYNTLGAYVNPTFLICYNDNKIENLRIYLDASFEFLANTIKTSYNYSLADSVSFPYSSTVKKADVLGPNDPRIIQPVITQHLITGYYGIGPQVIYWLKDAFYLNLLFLTGYSVTGIENDANTPVTYSSSSYKSRQLYYFAKGVFTEKVTKLNATIGVEVRGFYPNNTGIAGYLGFLVSPSDFFKK